ncbi:MAG TPA: hypothetical protein VF476_03680 [Chitinophagaceae bacterium]
MKKITVAILSVYYLAVACGITVNFHFCMERLASVKLFESKAKKCGRCGMEIHQSNGCCRDEIEVVKLQDDHQKASVVAFELPLIESLAVTPSEFIVADFQNTNEQRHFHNHSPPLLSAQDTYLQINVFRI